MQNILASFIVPPTADSKTNKRLIDQLLQSFVRKNEIAKRVQIVYWPVSVKEYCRDQSNTFLAYQYTIMLDNDPHSLDVLKQEISRNKLAISLAAELAHWGINARF